MCKFLYNPDRAASTPDFFALRDRNGGREHAEGRALPQNQRTLISTFNHGWSGITHENSCSFVIPFILVFRLSGIEGSAFRWHGKLPPAAGRGI
jgi:hypothetical protein